VPSAEICGVALRLRYLKESSSRLTARRVALDRRLFYPPTCVTRFCLQNPPSTFLMERFGKMKMLNIERNSRSNSPVDNPRTEITSLNHSHLRNLLITDICGGIAHIGQKTNSLFSLGNCLHPEEALTVVCTFTTLEFFWISRGQSSRIAEA